MDLKTIENKIQKLREEYKNAPKEKRKIIIRRARLLEIAKEKLMELQQPMV